MSFWDKFLLKVRSGLRLADKALGLPKAVHAFALDTALRIINNTTFSAGTTNTDPVDTEGGIFAIFKMYVGAFTTTGDTLDVEIQASIDGGSNYYQIATFPQIEDDEDDMWISRVGYIPRPTLSSGYQAPSAYTKVRAEVVVSSGGSAEIEQLFIEPLISLGVPALDEELSEGLAKLT